MPTPVLKNRVHTAKQQARKERIRNELHSDFEDPGSGSNGDVFVLSSEEVIELWIAKQRKSGKSDDDINRHYGELSGDETFNLIKAHASNVVALGRDTANLAVLMRDFKHSGNVLGEYRTTIRNGRKYIIFKGNHKLRKIIKGTFYAARNPKLMKFGIGLDGAKYAGKSHVLVTLFISVGLNGYAWIFDPKFGWEQFLINISSDLVKAALSALAGYLGYAIVAPLFSTVAIPIVLGVAVSAALGVYLTSIDSEGELTNRVIESMVDTCDEWSAGLKGEYRDTRNTIRQSKEALERKGERLYYHLLSEAGEWAFERVQEHVEEELRRFAHRVLDYSPQLAR